MTNGNVALTEFYASSATQWTARAVETTASGAAWMLTAQAFCVAGT